MSLAMSSGKQACASLGRSWLENVTQSSLLPCAAPGSKPRAKSLHGNWDEALLFCLKTALETYRFSENQIQQCDHCIERQLATFEIRTPLPNARQSLRTQLHQVCGVDLTKIPGIKEQAAQIIISEVGLDMSPWNT